MEPDVTRTALAMNPSPEPYTWEVPGAGLVGEKGNSMVRIAVYTIAKDEAQYVSRWAENTRLADYRLVADTGSTDETVRLLRGFGIVCPSIRIDPWRFDTARNAALAQIPEWVDLCIAVDMDEVFADGWREAIERSWTEAESHGHRLTRLYHQYVWNWQPDGSPGLSLTLERVHSRFGYLWRFPVHEGTYPYGIQTVADTCVGLTIEHRPNTWKEPGHYLGLCELSYQENPSEARACYYLGRELAQIGAWERSLQVLSGYFGLRGVHDWEARSVVELMEEGRRALGLEAEAYPANQLDPPWARPDASYNPLQYIARSNNEPPYTRAQRRAANRRKVASLGLPMPD